MFIKYFISKNNNFEHMASIDEAIQNVASIYNQANMKVSSLQTTGNTNVDGVLKVGGDININGNSNTSGLTTVNKGIYTKGGSAGGGAQTHFPYENGENYIRGVTNVDGLINANQGLKIQGVDILAAIKDLQANVIRKDKGYIIQSGRGGYLIDNGGWSSNFDGTWEQMYFRQSGKCTSDGNGNNNAPPRYNKNSITQPCSA